MIEVLNGSGVVLTLTQPDLADHAPRGVLIRGAHIDGSLDLQDAHIS